MQELKYPKRDELKKLINNNSNFVIKNITGDLLYYSSMLEEIIESNGMSCRISTKKRTAINLLFCFATGVPLIAQIAHNIITYDPDWKIMRDFGQSTIEVKYCK